MLFRSKQLLNILRQNFGDLPIEPTTLLQTKQVGEIVPIGERKYCHVGILHHVQESLALLIDKNNFNFSKFYCPRVNVYKISLIIGIDGLPISRSSKAQF